MHSGKLGLHGPERGRGVRWLPDDGLRTPESPSERRRRLKLTTGEFPLFRVRCTEKRGRNTAGDVDSATVARVDAMTVFQTDDRSRGDWCRDERRLGFLWEKKVILFGEFQMKMRVNDLSLVGYSYPGRSENPDPTHIRPIPVRQGPVVRHTSLAPISLGLVHSFLMSFTSI
ncbi:hypothetical protein V6N11_036412 [Hibiscus sabdariffa]|uniref:Uncharacterized protein n=1 Tax=Hibiscus sabdariffa TaxID=183260 RepID=A0ABR2RAL5_9ROSI